MRMGCVLVLVFVCEWCLCAHTFNRMVYGFEWSVFMYVNGVFMYLPYHISK